MAVCPECGEQVPDGADFCLSCGSVIKDRSADGAPEEVPPETPITPEEPPAETPVEEPTPSEPVIPGEEPVGTPFPPPQEAPEEPPAETPPPTEAPQETPPPEEPPVSAPQETQKSPRELIDEGENFYNSKKFNEAIKSFEAALSQEPKNSKAWFAKAMAIKDWGIALDDQEKVKSSIEAFDKSLEIDPRNGESWYQKGMVLGLLEDSEKAIESFETALKLDPSNANYEMMYNAAKQQAKEKKAAPPPPQEEVEIVEKTVDAKKTAPIKAVDMKIPFPKNYTALISGPPGVGKYEYCLSLVKEYLKKGENVVYVTTERSPQEIKDKLREDGFDLDTYETSQFLFVDIYSHSTGTKYDKGLHVDNPANLNQINIHLANASQTLGKPMRIFFDSLSTLFLHAPVAEIKKFVGVLSSRAKTEYGFVLYTIQEGQHDDQTAMSLRAMAEAVLESSFDEGPPLKRRFRVHHAKGMRTTPTWYIFDIEGGFKIIGEERKLEEAAKAAEAAKVAAAAPKAEVAKEVVVEKAGVPKVAVVGVLAFILIAAGAGIFFMKGGDGGEGGGGENVQINDIYSLKLDKTVDVNGEQVEAFIDVTNRIDSKAPTKGWLIIENPFYRIDLNLDHPYYTIFDKINDQDLLVFNDRVTSETDWLTASTLGYADYDGENLQPFSSMAIHDADGIEHRIIVADEENGFLLLGTTGWDYQTADLKEGYDVEGEELFGIFADKPYFIDAVEINNLQIQGYAQPLLFRNPDVVVKDWVIRGDYDAGVVIGGDPDHLNRATAEEWSQVQTIGGVRKPWHAGSALFSLMMPDHIVVGNKIGGGMIFSLPQGKFRFDDSLGGMGDQVVLQFLILVQKPEKAIAFTTEPVSVEAYLYDHVDYATIPGYPQAMQTSCDKYGIECPSAEEKVFDAHNYKTKRFAYVITITKDWYNAAQNMPKDEVVALADEGLAAFKTHEDTIYNQMAASKPSRARLVIR